MISYPNLGSAVKFAFNSEAVQLALQSVPKETDASTVISLLYWFAYVILGLVETDNTDFGLVIP